MSKFSSHQHKENSIKSFIASIGLTGRTLPPAGPPLPLLSLVKALKGFISQESIKETLENQLKQYFNSEHIFLTDSGRSGLALALKSLHSILPHEEKEARIEVLIPAYVSYSVPSAVAHAGFKIRFYDICPSNLSPNYESMQAACSDKTLAIVACHQFGLPFDCTKAKEIAMENQAFLIDDAAQAMGGKIGNTFAAAMGDIGLFSLSRGKPLTAVEGGIILTNSDKIHSALEEVSREYKKAEQSKIAIMLADIPTLIKASALYLLRKPLLYSIPASLPFLNIGASVFEPDFPDSEMSPYRMGLTSANIPLLEKANIQRRKWAAKYTNFLSKQQNFRTILTNENAENIYLRYPLLPESGSEEYIQKILQDDNGKTAKKLGISRGFPLPLYAVPELQEHLAEIKDNPDELYAGAKYLAENLITLPTHDQVMETDFENIVNFLSKVQE